MDLPEPDRECIDALEAAGFPAYAVGGCVRDALLGLTPQDYDLCTAAQPDKIQEIFPNRRVILTGKRHGTITVLTEAGPVEITTFRREGAYLDNRHPEWVEFVTDIQEDLARRDFTVNAMAYSPTRGYADPFGGQQDLENRCLRAVGVPEQRFREDALRILRGLRFSARYGLTIAQETWQAMEAEKGLLDNLARERVFDELCKLLLLVNARDLAAFGPVLGTAIPELAPLIGFDQRSPHHAYDLFTHVAHVVEGVPQEPALRWAALLHDVGKIPTFTQDETGRGHFYGHAGKSAEMADEILRRLKAPTALRERVVLLTEKHMTKLSPDRKTLRRRVAQLGWEVTEQLLALQQADMGSKGTGNWQEMEIFPEIRRQLEILRQEEACLGLKDLAVKGTDLIALGLEGRAIGQTLNRLLEQVINEELPNDREILLASISKP